MLASAACRWRLSSCPQEVGQCGLQGSCSGMDSARSVTASCILASCYGVTDLVMTCSGVMLLMSFATGLSHPSCAHVAVQLTAGVTTASVRSATKPHHHLQLILFMRGGMNQVNKRC
eukprot:718806-Amphidinium_carterae.1